ncbi:MAG: polyhydroxyalkanoate depolymerase, partial [Alphaproteobacteria bacterium]
MLYALHEMQHLALMPWRMATEGLAQALANPLNPFRDTPLARNVASAVSIFEQLTRRYGKPAWQLTQTEIDGTAVAVTDEVVIHRTYCHLVHFSRAAERNDPRVLIVAPLSGHYATLLRGTVEALLPDHEVFITDWQDCRFIPITADRFNLADYIDYVIDFLHYLGPDTHVVAVCQPSVPVLAAIAVMSMWGDLCAPATATLIGGPIDTRRNPTAVNKLALDHPVDWFEDKVIQTVPPPYPGMMRKVYPGFVQLTNFVSMNLEKHMTSLGDLYDHLVEGDEEAAQRKQEFYDEYLAVMDLPAEFYLQTVKTVFQEHALPRGEMIFRWHPIDLGRIDRTAIQCIEGELDDICGVGQTKAALELTPNLPADMKAYYMQEGVGHYGVFNGGKYRREIAPRIGAFIRAHRLDARARRSSARAAAKPAARRRKSAKLA